MRAELGREPGGLHADAFTTSLMLALAPEAVRADKLGIGREFDARSVPTAWFMDEVDPQGFAGDTRIASRELGERLLERIGEYWLDELRRVNGAS